MDGLIILLIIIGIISKLNKKNKKKKASAPAPGKGNASPRIPFAPAEWEQYLKDLNIPIPETKAAADQPAPSKYAAPRVTPAAPKVKPPQPAAAAPKAKPVHSAAPLSPAPLPLLYVSDDEPEGTVSTQGESASEHAVHRERILAEEALLEQENAIRRELRSASLQKLRSAVVMSEILGKPVALREKRW